MEKERIAELVRKAQSGDSRAMERLLQLAHTSVSYQCRKIMTHAEDAEDMTQEVLIKIYNSLDTLKEPEKFLGWANSIAARRCINERKRNPKDLQFAEDEEGHSVLDDIEDLDTQNVPDAALDSAETVRMVQELVDGLPDAQRTCTYLYYYNQMSVQEIAEMVGVSEGTIKSRLNYARKTIKEGVQSLEKQGIKLYGLSPLPVLFHFLQRSAEIGADATAASAMAKAVLAAEGTAAAAGAVGSAAGTAGSSAGSAAGATGSAAGSAAGTAGSAAGATGSAAGVVSGVSTKIVAGVLAGVVAVGGIAAVVTTQREEPPEPTPYIETPAPTPTETPVVEAPVIASFEREIESWSYEWVTASGRTVTAEVSLERPRFEEVNEGYKKLNELFDALAEQFESGEERNVAYIAEMQAQQAELRYLSYEETYQVVSQDDGSVTIQLDWLFRESKLSSRRSGTTTFVFDISTGESSGYKGSEEGLAELEAQIESGALEYGTEAFIVYRPQFGVVTYGS